MTAQSMAQRSEDYARIEQAILYLEENFRQQPSLDEIAQAVHLSKYHFQRLFQRWAGISPKQFLQFLTLDYAKQMLRQSHSVLETSYEVGLSGPSRLHDLFVTFQAMTPGEYKASGDGLTISYGFHASPFGECLLATTDKGICALLFVPSGQRQAALDTLSQEWSYSRLQEEPSLTQPLIEQIFAQPAHQSKRSFNILLKGTNFQVKVWEALVNIPAGAMVSYQDVAEYIGQPKASRAVGNAIGQNPVGFLIPCHRVVRKVGFSRSYRWGVPRKRAILGWEASHQM